MLGTKDFDRGRHMACVASALLEHHSEHSGDECGSQRGTTPSWSTIAGVASALAVLDLGLAGLGRVHPSAMGKVQTVVTTASSGSSSLLDPSFLTGADDSDLAIHILVGLVAERGRVRAFLEIFLDLGLNSGSRALYQRIAACGVHRNIFPFVPRLQGISMSCALVALSGQFCFIINIGVRVGLRD